MGRVLRHPPAGGLDPWRPTASVSLWIAEPMPPPSAKRDVPEDNVPWPSTLAERPALAHQPGQTLSTAILGLEAPRGIPSWPTLLGLPMLCRGEPESWQPTWSPRARRGDCPIARRRPVRRAWRHPGGRCLRL